LEVLLFEWSLGALSQDDIALFRQFRKCIWDVCAISNKVDVVRVAQPVLENTVTGCYLKAWYFVLMFLRDVTSTTAPLQQPEIVIILWSYT
jgi:hypothetical protein